MASCCILGGLENFVRCIRDKVRFRKKIRKSIVLLVVGLDNAGKTSIVNYLFEKSLITEESVIPTIGFRTVLFNYKSLSIRLFDIGGGSQIRGLWPKYYADVHGVIYVVDTSDIERLTESANVFQELVCHELISRKPILLLGNKQDLQYAVDELDLIECMNIERIVNFVKSYTRVELCSCYPDKNKHFNLNKNIDKGFKWLVETIDYHYKDLEEEMKRKKIRKRFRRSFTLKSWTREIEKTSLDYTNIDSKTYLKPIVLKDNKSFIKCKRKKKSLKSLFYIRKNKTAPILEDSTTNSPTFETMRDLIKSIKIEDLLNNTVVDVNNISDYQRLSRRPKRRPNTAPAALKPIDVNIIQRIETIT